MESLSSPWLVEEPGCQAFSSLFHFTKLDFEFIFNLVKLSHRIQSIVVPPIAPFLSLIRFELDLEREKQN